MTKPLRMLSVRSAASRLGIGRTKLLELLRTGRLPAWRLDDVILIAVADLRAFAASLQRVTPEDFEALKARDPRPRRRKRGQPAKPERNQRVRDLHELGFTYREIGEEFGVTAVRAWQIVNGRRAQARTAAARADEPIAANPRPQI